MYFFYDVAIRAQLAIFFAEPRQLLTLRGRETRAALRAIGARALDPVAQGGFGQIEIAGDGRNRLAVLEDQADRLGFELVVKLPARPALGGVCHRSGHRIHLSEDVHETGSIPPRFDESYGQGERPADEGGSQRCTRSKRRNLTCRESREVNLHGRILAASAE